MSQEILTYTYFDFKTMEQICQVRRTADKKITQWTWENNEWVPKGLPSDKPKPLYNALDLLKKPNAPILLVEGEKTCEAAKKLFPEMVCMTWLGGTGVAAKVDLELLENKAVYLWPDNDKIGFKAMDIIAQRLLREDAAQVLMVDFKGLKLPEKWDLADEYPLQEISLEDLINDAKEVMLVSENSRKEKTSTWLSFPNRADKKPLNTIENLEFLLNHYSVSLKENLMTHKLEYVGLSCSAKNASSRIKSFCALHGLSSSKVDDYLPVIAEHNQYHPVVEWINQKPWDGVNRFNDLLNTLKTDDDPALVRELLYRWMLGAIEAIYSPIGVRMPGALVLQGLTNIGKTFWMLKLAPEAFLKEGESLGTNDKDSVMQITSHWIVELGEIAATYGRSDVNSLKNFITRGADTYRKSFRRDEQTEPRRTVFFGSVNEQSYLVDKTGNRRWWTISVNAVDSYHEINMQQLWAEILGDYKKGKRCTLARETERLLAEHNQNFEVRDYLHDLVASRYHWEEPIEFHQQKSAQEIMKEILPGENAETYNRMYKRLATVLQEGFRLKMKRTCKSNTYLMPRIEWK